MIGTPLLIVIVATYCQYTLQYPELNNLKTQYSPNFEILAFPCNQFGLQEPGVTPTEILNGIRYVRPGNNYIPNFPMFEKTDVNGAYEQPLFTFLKKHCPPPIDEIHSCPNITYVPVRSNDLRWNFEKFLIDANGRPIKRFASDVTPSQLEAHINSLIQNSPESINKQRQKKFHHKRNDIRELFEKNFRFPRFMGNEN
ncbi:unnamed protein product [Didymodactylos carnosus]|uniref:Glutathione peroxidase n=1 Tax=Didymodactylos carnosus TaxID=1234261 RepID=A0A8S2D961_9BILA|nr:unnamed protein product [Didymodactylos carnosus]CAF3622177.1 unnamed protein product [Didymodactylos carnosus]